MNEEIKVNLIDQEKVSIKEVVDSLLLQKSGTKWSEKTSDWAVDYTKHLGEVYGDVWYKGYLPEEYIINILLPKHGHSEKELDSAIIFPLDTSVKEALVCLLNSEKEQTKECLSLVDFLKEKIVKEGFNSSIILAVINGTLKHVDGLHRLIAIYSLINDGYKYQPIQVFLCDSTK